MKYLDLMKVRNLVDYVELGVTGDVVHLNREQPVMFQSRFERVVVKGHEDKVLWVETHLGEDGVLTGDWDAVRENDARELKLID